MKNTIKRIAFENAYKSIKFFSLFLLNLCLMCPLVLLLKWKNLVPTVFCVSVCRESKYIQEYISLTTYNKWPTYACIRISYEKSHAGAWARGLEHPPQINIIYAFLRSFQHILSLNEWLYNLMWKKYIFCHLNNNSTKHVLLVWMKKNGNIQLYVYDECYI